jgi:metal-dependent amidase/aminoacylase/carboxypeptidase family protein
MYREQRLEPFDDASALLGTLTDEPHALWAIPELEREFGWSSERVQDALADLGRSGLAHQIGNAVFPSRAAVRCRELLA